MCDGVESLESEDSTLRPQAQGLGATVASSLLAWDARRAGERWTLSRFPCAGVRPRQSSAPQVVGFLEGRRGGDGLGRDPGAGRAPGARPPPMHSASPRRGAVNGGRRGRSRAGGQGGG